MLIWVLEIVWKLQSSLIKKVSFFLMVFDRKKLKKYRTQGTFLLLTLLFLLKSLFYLTQEQMVWVLFTSLKGHMV